MPARAYTTHTHSFALQRNNHNYHAKHIGGNSSSGTHVKSKIKLPRLHMRDKHTFVRHKRTYRMLTPPWAPRPFFRVNEPSCPKTFQPAPFPKHITDLPGFLLHQVMHTRFKWCGFWMGILISKVFSHISGSRCSSYQATKLHLIVILELNGLVQCSRQRIFRRCREAAPWPSIQTLSHDKAIHKIHLLSAI